MKIPAQSKPVERRHAPDVRRGAMRQLVAGEYRAIEELAPDARPREASIGGKQSDADHSTASTTAEWRP